MYLQGFTIVELMIASVVTVALFALVFTVVFTSDRSWQEGQERLAEQQQARRAMDAIVADLRESSPEWGNGTYPVLITGGNRIDFYNTDEKITFKLDPANPRQLLRKEGNMSAAVVANDIESIDFGGGCPSCSAFNCSTVANDCPQVKITVQTKKGKLFTLQSFVTLRNQNIALGNGTVMEEPEEGEF